MWEKTIDLVNKWRAIQNTARHFVVVRYVTVATMKGSVMLEVEEKKK